MFGFASERVLALTILRFPNMAETYSNALSPSFAPLTPVLLDLPFPVSLTDGRNGYVFINKPFERKYGYTLDMLHGRGPGILTPRGACVSERFLKKLHAGTRAGGWSGQLVNCSESGQRMNIGLRTLTITAPGGDANPDTAGKAFLGVACDAGAEDMRDRAMLDLLMKRLMAYTEAGNPCGGPPALTKRQREIYELLCAGYAYKGIAYELGISHATVRVIVSELRKLLGPVRVPILRRD